MKKIPLKKFFFIFFLGTILTLDLGYHLYLHLKKFSSKKISLEHKLENTADDFEICDGNTCGQLKEALVIEWNPHHTEVYIKNNIDIFELSPEPFVWIAYDNWGGLLYKKSQNKLWLKERNWHGSLVKQMNNLLIVNWRGMNEVFIKNNIGVYTLRENILKKVKIFHDNHVIDFSIFNNNLFITPWGETAEILELTTEKIVVRWSFGRIETFLKDNNDIYKRREHR